jgi:uncharacterized protein YuzE
VLFERLVLAPAGHLPKARVEGLDPEQPWRVDYDGARDVVALRCSAARAAVAAEVDDAWLRIDPASGDIMGVEIESFTGGYLAARPDVGGPWEAFRDRHTPEGDRRVFLESLIESLQRRFADALAQQP